MASTNFFIGTLYDPTTGVGTSTTGTVAKMLSVPMPNLPADASAYGYSEQLDFEYGGSDIVDAPQTHREYEFNWSGPRVTGETGMDRIKRLSNGEFGKGLIYFADPFNYTTNLMPPAWAAPALIEQGWRNIFDTTPTFSAVSSNNYDQPLRKATWSVTSAANALPTDKRGILVLPIPPDHSISLGFSGSATGTAVIRARPINLDGSYGSTTNLTLLTDTNVTRLNYQISGATYKAVELYITRTSTASSTLTITSGMAQLWPTGATPVLSGQFIGGQGNTGCKFQTRAVVEEYRYNDNGRQRLLKGLSASLVEVGTAARYA